jgi:hypothetical protein
MGDEDFDDPPYLMVSKALGENCYANAYKIIIDGKRYWCAKIVQDGVDKGWQFDREWAWDLFCNTSFADHHPYWMGNNKV